jgi:hypothetical protein
MWIGLVITVAASAGLVGIFFSNTAEKNESPFTQGPVDLVAPLPKSVEFTDEMRHDVGLVAAEFVATAVFRTNTERSYDLTDQAFHQGLTRAQWGTGNIPVVPYPREAVDVVKWRLDYSYRDRVGLKISLQPKPTAKVGGMVFNIELRRLGPPGKRHWLVDYWTPAGQQAPAPSRSAARGPLGPATTAKPGLGAAWLFVPVGLVFGLILAIPLVLAVRGWRRRVRADRAYRALQGGLPEPRRVDGSFQTDPR